MSVIETNYLKKRYNGKYVLKGINLSIDAGQVVGYIGPNGAGKSTTIKIIAGITDEFDGDGSTDIAVFRPSDGNWYINRSPSNTTDVYNFGLSTDHPITTVYTP